MRLIDADALHKSIDTETYRHTYIDQIHEVIDNAPTIEPKTGEWIPFSERLPREYAQYLVCFESGECHVYWLEDSDWARGMAEKDGIIAWMPLPKPYKEDSK